MNIDKKSTMDISVYFFLFAQNLKRNSNREYRQKSPMDLVVYFLMPLIGGLGELVRLVRPP